MELINIVEVVRFKSDIRKKEDSVMTPKDEIVQILQMSPFYSRLDGEAREELVQDFRNTLEELVTDQNEEGASASHSPCSVTR